MTVTVLHLVLLLYHQCKLTGLEHWLLLLACKLPGNEAVFLLFDYLIDSIKL